MRVAAVTVLAAASALAAIATGATPKAASPPACSYCRMLVADSAYGGAIRTTDGRRLVYDSIECMAAAVLTDSVPPRRIRAAFVREREAPHRELDPAKAVFLQSATLESPMGLNLSAHASAAAAQRARGIGEGLLFDWRQVLEHVDARWFQGRLDVPSHAKLPAAKP